MLQRISTCVGQQICIQINRCCRARTYKTFNGDCYITLSTVKYADRSSAGGGDDLLWKHNSASNIEIAYNVKSNIVVTKYLLMELPIDIWPVLGQQTSTSHQASCHSRQHRHQRMSSTTAQRYGT